jgi:hypothetical protein
MAPIVVVASLLLLLLPGNCTFHFCCSVTLEIFLAEAVSCSGGSSAISDADRQAMVDFHNYFRSLTANGKAVNKDGSFLPAGKNVYQVVNKALLYYFNYNKDTFHFKSDTFQIN